MVYRRARFISVVECGKDVFRMRRAASGLPHERHAIATHVNAATFRLWCALDSEHFMTGSELACALHAATGDACDPADVTAALERLVELEMVETETTSHGYDDQSAWYDARPGHDDAIFDRVRRHTEEEHRRSILEVGCGTGAVLERLASLRPRHLQGVDVSRPMLERAAERLRRAGITASLRHGRAELLPVANRSVTLLVVATALHWFDRSVFFAEAERVLAPRHRLIVWHRAPNIDSDNPLTRWMKRALATPTCARWVQGSVPALIDGLPATVSVRHYDLLEETMTIADERAFRDIARSLTVAELTPPFDPLQDLVSEGAEWPVSVPCTTAFAVLEVRLPPDRFPIAWL